VFVLITFLYQLIGAVTDECGSDVCCDRTVSIVVSDNVIINFVVNKVAAVNRWCETMLSGLSSSLPPSPADSGVSVSEPLELSDDARDRTFSAGVYQLLSTFLIIESLTSSQ